MFETNEYFEGKVKSIAYDNASGKYTVGVMADGAYTFGTSSNEEMTVVNGQLDVKLPGQESWTTYTPGQSFIVEANSSFKVKSVGDSAYLCRYY